MAGPGLLGVTGCTDCYGVPTAPKLTHPTLRDLATPRPNQAPSLL